MGLNEPCVEALKGYCLTHLTRRALKLKNIRNSPELEAFNETQLRDAAFALHERGVIRIAVKSGVPVTLLDFGDIQILP